MYIVWTCIRIKVFRNSPFPYLQIWPWECDTTQLLKEKDNQPFGHESRINTDPIS